jgi:hypothetical protein
MSCSSPWEYEKKTGAGWSYDEPTLAYDATDFDTSEVYYDSLSLVTIWDTDTAPSTATYEYEAPAVVSVWTTDSAPSVSVYEYSILNGDGYEYDQDTLEYDAPMFQAFTVYYDKLGLVTEWQYDSLIEGCLPVPYLFMDGIEFQFQNGTIKEFNSV